MKKENFTLVSNFDSLVLSGLLVTPAKEPKGVVQLVHGMSEYKERYLPFMEFLADKGFASVITDHRGHGKSITEDHPLGYFGKDGEKAILSDTHQVTAWMKERFPGKPFTLFGHSMGSMIVRCYLQNWDNELDSLIVSGEVSKNPIGGIGHFLAKVIAFFKGQKATSPFFISLSTGPYSKAYPSDETPNLWLNTDREKVREYDNDPLCGFPFTMNGYVALTGLLNDTFKARLYKVQKPGLPIHFISGDGDPCRVDDTAFADACRFLEEVGYQNVTGHLFKNMRHEVLNEPEHQLVYDEILEHLAK